jgi:hypothetical protein
MLSTATPQNEPGGWGDFKSSLIFVAENDGMGSDLAGYGAGDSVIGLRRVVFWRFGGEYAACWRAFVKPAAAVRDAF